MIISYDEQDYYISNFVNDKKIIGVIKNKNSADSCLIYTNGECNILVSDFNGKIGVGDLITTSSIIGVGMLQDDDIVRSSTIGKCIELVDWENGITEVIEYKNKNYKKTKIKVKLMI